MDQTARAEQLRRDAEAELRRKFTFFSSVNKYEEAARLFSESANFYKISNRWAEAGEMYSQAADCCLKRNERSDAAKNFMEAAQCARKANDERGIGFYQQALNIYIELQRFTQCSKITQELGEIFLENHNHEAAADAFRQCAQFNIAENKSSIAHGFYNRIGLILAEKALELLDNRDTASRGNQMLKESADLFEQVGRYNLTVRTIQYNAKTYFFMSILCYLAMGDAVGADLKLNDYLSVDSSFENTRESTFLQTLIAAFNEMKPDEFGTAASEYHNYSRLDPLKTSLLFRAKKHIINDEGGEDDDIDLR